MLGDASPELVEWAEHTQQNKNKAIIDGFYTNYYDWGGIVFSMRSLPQLLVTLKSGHCYKEEILTEYKTNEFTAISDDGQEYSIYEYSKIIDVGHQSDPNATIEGIKRLCTSECDVVNFKGEGIYEIVASGIILRKINK